MSCQGDVYILVQLNSFYPVDILDTEEPAPLLSTNDKSDHRCMLTKKCGTIRVGIYNQSSKQNNDASLNKHGCEWPCLFRLSNSALSQNGRAIEFLWQNHLSHVHLYFLSSSQTHKI